MSNDLPLKELSIYDVFNSIESITYEIPIYQRNYAWEKDEIEALVRDIWDALDKKNETYYIGTLVTFDKGDYTYEVIDGQQRLTTLFLLLKALNIEVRNKLTYRARKRSDKTIKEIPNFCHDHLDDGIKKGYEDAVNAIEDTVESGNKALFADYLQNHVHIIHYNVPKDVDLNHYFEVMNSRGEQLEKHEIVKAKLMNELDDSDKSKFAAIWQACSEMDYYIQTKKYLEPYFENNLKDFRYYNSSFDDLPSVEEATAKQFSLRSLIYGVDSEEGNRRTDEYRKSGMFQPIIDFPNFLLIVLKITRLEDARFDPETFILNDKELLNEFNKDTLNPAFAKRFSFNLLKAKYLLDNYVVHHSKEEDTYEHNPWQLRYWNNDEKAQSKNLSNDDKLQNNMVQLLSMFEVSFTARQRKNYLFYVLCHLFKNRDLRDYCDFLECLAKKYFCDIYMREECLNEINTPKPGAFDQVIIEDGKVGTQITNQNPTDTDFNRIYGDGSVMTKGIPLFVFNYIDYLIWKKYADEMAGEKLKESSEERQAFFSELGCSDFGLEVFNHFYFSRTRRSLEHYFPQANINEEINESQINCLGNFAMIGSEANSSGSNWSPKVKLDHYLDSSHKISKVSVASLKFRIMLQICKDNTTLKPGKEWMYEDIQKHQQMVLRLLFDDKLTENVI